MISCIYEGRVRHRRFRPILNTFSYRIFMMFIDLDELPHLFEDRWFWSVGRPNLAYFRRRDHLGNPRVSLDEAVRDCVEKALGRRPAGPIRLLTHFRYFGYCFNPVSFYYLYKPHDDSVETIVAEVHNTPWGEEHCYVLDESGNEHPVPPWKRFQFEKVFHVSPFMNMDIKYDWRFREPDHRLSVHFNSFEGGHKLFDATLSLKRREISASALARVLMAYPLMTMKVTAMIYWQALRLKVKGAPFCPHPQR